MPFRKRLQALCGPREVHSQNGLLKHFGHLMHDARLWRFNRRSVTKALGMGLFFAWIPFPSQMLLSAIGAMLFRINLPVAVAVVWITNPITIPPMYYAAYRFGAHLLNEPTVPFQIELSWAWMGSMLSQIWQPLLLGCSILGVLFAFLGYFLLDMVWRMHLIKTAKRWKARRDAARAENCQAAASRQGHNPLP